MDGPEADGQPVPGVDRADQHGQVDLLGGGEVPGELLVIPVGSMGLGHQGQGLGPGEGGPLPVVEERRFPPGVEEVEPLLRLAAGAGILGVHVEAEGAAVDLRGAGLHQLDQAVLQPAVLQDLFELHHRLQGAGGDFEGHQPGFHRLGPRVLGC